MAQSKGARRRRRLEMKEAREEKALVALKMDNKNKKRQPKIKTKRKSPTEMIELLPRTVRGQWLEFKIREPKDWVSKSYNEERQLRDFVNWLFCEYPVPRFMFDLFLPSRRNPIIGNARRRGQIGPARAITFSEGNFKVFMAWFIAIAQGYSFAKEAKGTFTKREAHLFLNAPSENTLIGNIWWARCKARNIPDNITHFIVQRFIRNGHNSRFWISFLDFVSNNKDELNTDTLQELLDFLPAHRRREEKFSLKGRTLNSLIQLSNEWHREQQVTKHGSKVAAWDGIDIPDWKWVNKKERVTWTVKQILTSKELYAEGRRMRHCVYGYVQACANSRSAIFTMTSVDMIGQEEKHLTIEVVGGRRIQQAKGKLNRRPTNKEANILHKWAIDKNLGIDSWVV